MQKRNLTLLTDLYELTMMNGYYLKGKKDQIAVFDVFFRQNELITYSLSAGLEQAVDYVLGINFDDEEIGYLRSLGIFDDGFLEYLKTLIRRSRRNGRFPRRADIHRKSARHSGATYRSRRS